MSGFAQRERLALANLLISVGPDAPTLCAGWTTRDLAAHLVLRATRADAGAGIVIPALAGHTRRVQGRVAAREWTRLVEQVRRRPWWAVGIDDLVNQAEYFIHHEDIRRAQPDWQPRPLGHDDAAALFGRVRLQARLVLRRTPATVSVAAPGFGSVTAGQGGPEAPAGAGSPEVELRGEPGELLLFLSGRQSHSVVELDGPIAITDRMRTAAYGI